MKILTLTTLYPNSEQYRHGIFIENRLRNLREKYPNIQLKVVAPVPYFPFTHAIFGEYAKCANVPALEVRHGVEVYHPRYLVIPKIGMMLTPYFLYRAMKKAVRNIQSNGYDFDLIDAHYFYPDGISATKLANEIEKPIVVSARGSDITFFPSFPKIKKAIQQTLLKVDAAIGVCKALVDEMKAIQPKQKCFKTIRNGVDLTLFSPVSAREALREKLGFNGFTLLMVGNLVELKGHQLVIEALLTLSDVNLAIIGEGPLELPLKAFVKKHNLTSRVKFLGGMKQPNLPSYYASADCLVLASSREGWPNVLLEAMACGTPVIATKVWGTPEVITSEDAGILVDRNVKDITDGILHMMNNKVSRDETRAYAEKFNWDDTSTLQYQLFEQIIRNKS